MCIPEPPLVLGQPDRPELVEHLVGDVGHPLHPVPRAVRARVEVDPPLVGLLDVGPAAVPRVELDGRHLHGPDDVGQLGDAQLVGRAVVARERHPHRLQPRRRPVRHPLLVHLLAGHALGEPVHHARPLAQRVDDPVAHRQVVVDQVELGLAAGREVHPVGVGDPHVALADLDLDRGRGRLGCHAPTLRAGMPRCHAAARRTCIGQGRHPSRRSQPAARGRSYARPMLEQKRVLATSIPGPKSQALQQRKLAAVSAGVGTGLPVYIEQAAGGILRDVDGNQLIDFGSGIAVTTVGNGNQRVIDAVTAQINDFTHTCFMVTPYEEYLAGRRGARRGHARRRTRSGPRCSTPAPRPSRTPSRWPATSPAARASSRSTTPTTGAPTSRWA